MIEEKEQIDTMSARPNRVALEPDRQRALAAELFNYVWTLMEDEARSERESQMMVAAAYASRFFWEGIAEPFRLARGEWQISRACAVAGRAEAALWHAQACLDISQSEQLGPFDVGYAYEALARAHQVQGNPAAAEYIEQARTIALQIVDQDERDLLNSDLDALAL